MIDYKKLFNLQPVSTYMARRTRGKSTAGAREGSRRSRLCVRSTSVVKYRKRNVRGPFKLHADTSEDLNQGWSQLASSATTILGRENESERGYDVYARVKSRVAARLDTLVRTRVWIAALWRVVTTTL